MASETKQTQQAVLTIWKDGSSRVWGAGDAEYSKADDDYLVTLPVSDIVDDAMKDGGLRLLGKRTTRTCELPGDDDAES